MFTIPQPTLEGRIQDIINRYVSSVQVPNFFDAAGRNNFDFTAAHIFEELAGSHLMLEI